MAIIAAPALRPFTSGSVSQLRWCHDCSGTTHTSASRSGLEEVQRHTPVSGCTRCWNGVTTTPA